MTSPSASFAGPDVMVDRMSRRRVIASGGAAMTVAVLDGTLANRTAGARGAATPATTPTSWDDIDTMLTAVAPSATMIAAEIIDGSIEPIHTLNADEVQPVGSTFKLWVLGALAMQVEAGALDWDQPVEIEDRYRSVPRGDLRYVRAGTTFTMRYLAERMIQKSDNTATDHLLFLAGRETVEAAMATMGHNDPARNIPLISTREMAMLRIAYPEDQMEAYLAAPVAERRRILAEEVPEIPYEALLDFTQTEPLEFDRFEWFATREDLARTMAWHLATADRPDLRPVREVLTLESFIPFDGETWPYVGYKGGSEMGVLSGTWLLERADGRHFVYSVGYADQDKALDMAAAVAGMEGVRDRLAETE